MKFCLLDVHIFNLRQGYSADNRGDAKTYIIEINTFKTERGTNCRHCPIPQTVQYRYFMRQCHLYKDLIYVDRSIPKVRMCTSAVIIHQAINGLSHMNSNYQ